MARWSLGQKKIARALISYPDLVRKAVLASDVMPGTLNDELRTFIDHLAILVAKYPDDPSKALLQTPVKRGGVLAYIFYEVHGAEKRKDFNVEIDKWDCDQVINDFLKKRFAKKEKR